MSETGHSCDGTIATIDYLTSLVLLYNNITWLCYTNFFSWLRKKWNSSPVVVSGAEDEEYLLTIDDIGSSLVFMYTPVTEEGAKGEPQYKYTDFIKAGK